MATYVNNLRLKEIATGDESGTWGSSTNTNLELIGEALGFGTEAITTNADTHTTTIADGSSDAGRALFLKYTGTLDSACTITIGPNTMKRVHIIENATSGSQNIIISQGSGGNVTIGNGDTKIVYLDGAGSGAAVVDALIDLDLSGGTAKVGTLASNSGDIILDSANEIDLDVGSSAATRLKNNGTLVGTITQNPLLGIQIDVEPQDKFFIISGDDGGSSINALSISMANAGAATFNGAITANAGVNVDNITIDGTEIDLSSGDLTIDVAGDIILDADGADIKLADGGTVFGELKNESSYFVLKNPIQDQDVQIKGNDGGSEITALTLDMSGAGAATFNNDVTAFSDKRLKTDISNIENGIEKVMQMQGVHYKRNDIEDAKPQIGVLAQDMEAIVPEIVLTADDEMQTKSVDYGKLTAVLIEAIKDLKAEIDELKGR